jgi:hypothetical protein
MWVRKYNKKAFLYEADIFLVNKKNHIFLHLVIQKKSIKIIAIFLDKKAFIFIQNLERNIILYLAAD